MSLSIVKQDAAFIDPRIVSGKPVRVHYVVKRTPFSIHLEADPKAQNLSKGKLSCELLLDEPDLKRVDGPVIEFVARPASSGESCAMDVRLLLLSSQVAVPQFRLRISHELPGKNPVSVITEPVVCVSKQQQIRNRMREFLALLRLSPSLPAKTLIVQVDKALHRDTAEESRRIAKRARSEDIVVMLDKIINTQLHHSLLEYFYSAGGVATPPTASATPTLDVALVTLARAYSAEPEEERPEKLRRLMERMAPAQQQALKEFGSAVAPPPEQPIVSGTPSQDPFSMPLNSSTGISPFKSFKSFKGSPERDEEATTSPNPDQHPPYYSTGLYDTNL